MNDIILYNDIINIFILFYNILFCIKYHMYNWRLNIY